MRQFAQGPTKQRTKTVVSQLMSLWNNTPWEAALNSWAAQTQNIYVDLEKCNETFQTTKFSIVTPLSHIFPE